MKSFANKFLLGVASLVMVLSLQKNTLYSMDSILSGATDGLAEGLEGAGESAISSITSSIGDDVTASVTGALGDDAAEVLGKLPSETLESIGQTLGTGISDALDSLESGDTAAFQSGFSSAVTDFGSDLQEAVGSDITVDTSKLDAALNPLADKLETAVADLQKISGGSELDPIDIAGGDAAEVPEPEPAPSDSAAGSALNTGDEVGSITKELNEATSELDEALEKPEEEKGLFERLTGQTVGAWTVQHLVMGLVSGFVFLFPNWIMSAIEGNLTKKAQLATISAPQYWGGLWLQIPNEFINADNPAESTNIYSLVTNPDAKKFYSGANSRFKQPLGVGESKGKVDNNNFFVTSGNYNNCTYPNSWGVTAITGQGFSNQMIHLNSGLEIMGNGDPINTQYPYRQLMPQGGNDTPNNCAETIGSYLYSLSGATSGAPFSESYGMFQGTGMITASGAPTESKKTSTAIKATAKKFWTSATQNLFTNKFVDINESKAQTTYERMSSLFNLGAPAVTSGAKKLSGGFGLRAMQKPTSAIMKLSGLTDTSSYSPPLTAQGTFIYQTADTPLAGTIRRMLTAQSTAGAAAANSAFDYVLCLDENYTIVPGVVPVVAQQAAGASSTKPGYIRWNTNPKVKYIFSLIDTSAYDVKTGKSAEFKSNIVSFVTQNAGKLPKFPAFLSDYPAYITASVKKGPFVYGNFTVTIPTELASLSNRLEAPIYAVDPAKNNKKSTLENGATDYVVPLNSSFSPVEIPDATHTYWVSLVTSRFYNTDFTPAKEKQLFTIMTANNSIYLAASNEVSSYESQGAKAACTKCVDLSAPLSTLYMEYELNPFNRSVLKFLPNLTAAIAGQLATSKDSIYTDAQTAGTWATQAAHAASIVTFALSSGGLSPAIIETLNKTYAKDEAAKIQQIATAITAAVTEAIKQGLNNGLIKNALKDATWTDIKTLLGTATNPAVSGQSGTPSVFAGLGSKTLASVLPKIAQPPFDSLPTTMGLSPASFQLQLAQSGLIGVGPLYIYNTWLLSISEGDGSSPSAASLNSTNSTVSNVQSPIGAKINSSWQSWVSFMMGKTQNEWLLYENLGPFGFTQKLIPNIVIEGTSIADFKVGDFVYVSDTYPGDFFIVAPSLDNGAYNGKIQPFNPANPQPILASLTSGTVYQRGAADVVSALQDDAGNPVQLSNASSIINNLKSATLRKKLNAVVASPPAGAWKRYTYANFLLTISPADVKNGSYVYQDISNAAKFPPALTTVTDFFVGANASSDGSSLTLNIPLESNPQYIISAVTGSVYDSTGPSDMSDVDTSYILSNVPGIRSDLRNQVETLIDKLKAAQAKEEAASTVSVSYTLDKNTVSALTAGTVTMLPEPFQNLTLYGGKYYAIIDQGSGGVQSIFDYAAKPISAGGKTGTVGVLYDFEGNPSSYYEGALLKVAREKAGITVNSDGSQVLGVPNMNPAIILKGAPCAADSKDASCTLRSFKTPLSVTQPEGTYTIYQYGSPATGIRIIAEFKPKDGSESYYIDLYSGDQFNASGFARIAQYPALVQSTTKKLIGSLGIDDSGNPRVFGPAVDGSYNEWVYSSMLQSKTKTVYTSFAAKNDSTLGLAISPSDLTATTSWSVQSKPSKLKGITWDPAVTYAPATDGSALSAYRYIGSQTTAQGTQYENARATWNPNYALDDVIAVVKGSAVTSLFMPPVESDMPGYVSLAPAGKNVFKTAAGDTTQYSVTVKPNLVDSRTKAQYLTLQDDVGIHFYIPEFQKTSGATLKALQKALKYYVSLSAVGQIGLVKPISNPSNSLEGIAAVLDVPSAQDDAVQKAILGSNAFWYDSAEQRYLYEFSSSDASAIYYRTDATYVDLRMGILYDINGVPTGSAMTYPELQLLLLDKNVKVPTVTDDPTGYKAPAGLAVVPAGTTLSKSTPFLRYGS